MESREMFAILLNRTTFLEKRTMRQTPAPRTGLNQFSWGWCPRNSQTSLLFPTSPSLTVKQNTIHLKVGRPKGTKGRCELQVRKKEWSRRQRRQLFACPPALSMGGGRAQGTSLSLRSFAELFQRSQEVGNGELEGLVNLLLPLLAGRNMIVNVMYKHALLTHAHGLFRSLFRCGNRWSCTATSQGPSQTRVSKEF